MSNLDSSILNRRYKLLERIGTGGMAVVYKAQDLSLGRFVAIKILRRDLTYDQEFLNRFAQEARSAAKMTHPNIVTVHDFGVDGTRYYIVMEFIEGYDLKSKIQKFAPFSTEEALNLAIQICMGVGYAHRTGLIHCDLKPQNVLINSDGRIKVTDFGIARALSTVHPDEKHDIVWGSPQYFSPEQAAGEAPTPASDVYSIGVTLFEMLTGQLPFNAENAQALAMKHLRDEPPSLRSLNPSVPEPLERVVRKVLSKEPSARYRTADQLSHILRSFRQQGTLDTATIFATNPAQTVTRVGTGTTGFSQAYSQSVDSPTAIANNRQTILRDGQGTFASLSVEEIETDWVMYMLLAIAIIAILGLIPLYAMVYFKFFPPV
jgi:serine/threonine-protein kinase